MMKIIPAALLAAATLAWAQAPIRGFAPGALAAQHELERKARAVPDPVRARAYMQRMAGEPHHAGSAASKAVAQYALGLLREWGYDAKIEEFEALLPYPTVRHVEMVAPVRYQARLSEPVIPEDPDSGDRNQLPVYNAYSASGDVTAPLVYVNYGVPKDYETLKKLGVDVKGKIVLARYGGSWRGTKPKVAAENGAVGCLIYSDPKDDGFFQGDVFPLGPYRPRQSAQRGSVMDMPLYVGDPLSPGWASENGSKRLSRTEAASIMKIPVLPISWADAEPLLAQLRGEVAPADWRGAIPVTYHIGAGETKVRIKTDFDWTSKPLYNVIATLPGARQPDEWVIYGNHHDAWVNGASDPVSGAVALLESARALGELRKTGWRPRRTIVFALWDGEEFGLLGSTEWVEKHRDELQAKAVAYINSDSNTGGKFGAGGSHVLEAGLREILRDIEDPAKSKSLLALSEEPAASPGNGTAEKGKPFALGPLGAGSDYVAFVHHAGVPSLNLGFSRPGNSGTYHSIYDSYTWFSRTMDKDFTYARLLAQVTATTLLRYSEAPLVAHDFRAVARVLREYALDLSKQHAKVDMAPALTGIDKLKAAADQYDAVLRSANGRLDAAMPAQIAAVNRLLLGAERALTRSEGLPGRPFYRHHIYAPGLYTGYSARTLPGVREAADLGRMAEANQQAGVLAQLIRDLTGLVEQATAALSAL